MIYVHFKKPSISISATIGFVVFVLLAALLFQLPVHAANEAVVTATVTVENISVSVDDGTVSYGVLGLNSTAGTNGSQTQTALNEGNVAIDIVIKGQNTAAWTLGATAGADQYVHRFCISACGSPVTNYTPLTTNNQTLVSNLAASGNQTFDLHITTPTSSSSFTQQSVDVTIMATSAL